MRALDEAPAGVTPSAAVAPTVIEPIEAMAPVVVARAPLADPSPRIEPRIEPPPRSAPPRLGFFGWLTAPRFLHR